MTSLYTREEQWSLTLREKLFVRSRRTIRALLLGYAAVIGKVSPGRSQLALAMKAPPLHSPLRRGIPFGQRLYLAPIPLGEAHWQSKPESSPSGTR